MKDDLVYLRHIQDCLHAIQSHVESDKERFMTDRKTGKATLRELQELSESTQHLSQTSKDMRPEIPWSAISGFRNVLAHDYLGINMQRVWEIIERDLTPLQIAVEAILSELEDTSDEDDTSEDQDAGSDDDDEIASSV